MYKLTFREVIAAGFPPKLIAEEFLKQRLPELEECVNRGAVGISLKITSTEAIAEGWIKLDDWLNYTSRIAAMMEDADGSDEGGHEFKKALDYLAREGDVPVVVVASQPDERKGTFFYRSTLKHIRKFAN